MERMRKDVLTFNASRALADAYVYKGMAMEYLKFVSNSNEVCQTLQDTMLVDNISSTTKCYQYCSLFLYSQLALQFCLFCVLSVS